MGKGRGDEEGGGREAEKQEKFSGQQSPIATLRKSSCVQWHGFLVEYWGDRQSLKEEAVL